MKRDPVADGFLHLYSPSTWATGGVVSGAPYIIGELPSEQTVPIRRYKGQVVAVWPYRTSNRGTTIERTWC